jgi:hypothetical protein
MAVSVACVDSAAEPVRVQRRFSFPNRSRGKKQNALACLVAVEVVKLTHAIARVMERKNI